MVTPQTLDQRACVGRKITSNVGWGKKIRTEQKLHVAPGVPGSEPQIPALPCGQINDNEDPEKEPDGEGRLRHCCRG